MPHDSEADRLMRARASAWRRGLLGAASLVLATVGVEVYATRASEQRAEQALALATDRLGSCLFTDPPGERRRADGDGDADGRALLEVRATQLTAMGLSPEQRLARPELRWPTRCAPLARSLAAEERRHRKGAEAASVERLAESFEASDSAVADWSPRLLPVLADLRADRRAMHHVDDVQGPPPSARADTVDSLDRRAMLLSRPFALTNLRFDPSFDESTRFVIDEPGHPDGPAYCLFEGGKARCTAIRGAAAQTGARLRPWGTREAGAPPLVFAGERGAEGVFDVGSGDPLPVPLPRGAFGAHAGAGEVDLIALRDATADLRLVRVAGRGKEAAVVETPLLGRAEAGNPEYNVGLFWSFVATKRAARDAAGVRLRVRELRPGEVGPEVDVGPLGEAPRPEAAGEEPHLQGCRSKGGVVLRVRGWDLDYFSFHRPEGWSPPVEASGPGGALSCHGAVATLVDLRGHVEGRRYEPVVTETVCTPGACAGHTVQTREVFARNADVTPEEARDVAVASVDDKLLLVWSAGEIGGLRMRLGRAEQLAKVTDVVLFDDHVEAGKRRADSTLLDFAVRAVPGGALLVLATTAGVFLYSVDGAGRLLSVPVQ